MAKLRRGRVAGALAVGTCALALALSLSGEEDPTPPLPEESRATAPAEPVTRTRSTATIDQWSQRLDVLRDVLDEQPAFTVHHLQAYDNGTLRLECSAPESNLRRVGEFRERLLSSPLGRGRTLNRPSIRILQHGACDTHGDVSEVLRFTVDLTPRDPAPGLAESGSLQLIARCDATR